MCRAGRGPGLGCAAPSRTMRRIALAACPPPMETTAIASGRAATGSRPWRPSNQRSGEERITGLQIFLALPYDDSGRGVSADLSLRQHARAFDRVEGKVDAGFLLELESVPPGREFVGPGLDRIDVAPGLVRDERSAPGVVAVMAHRRAAPLPGPPATPDQRRAHHIVPVAIDIRPDLDALSNDTLHGKAAAVDERINIFNMKSAAGRGALDSLSCFVHGDAIDMEITSHFDCGKGDAPDIYRKPLAGHWFPGNAGDTQRVKHGYPLRGSRQFCGAPHRCVQTTCRMDLFTKAKDLGIQSEFIDGQLELDVRDTAALKIILDALPDRVPYRFLEQAAVVRSGRPSRTELKQAAKFPLRWKILAGPNVIVQGETHDRVIVWPTDLPIGSYRLHLTDASSFSEEAPLIVAPPRAFGRG